MPTTSVEDSSTKPAVAKHAPREAAFGAAHRAGWKSIALGGQRAPAEWVEALDVAFFRDGRIDTYATLCTGYLDLQARISRPSASATASRKSPPICMRDSAGR